MSSRDERTALGRRKFLVGLGAGVAATALLPRRSWAAQEPVRIGAIGALTDFTGRDIRNAVQLAIDEINAAGGMGGRKVQLFAADDENVPEKAIQAFQQLTVRDRVHAVVGGFRSGAVLALLPHIARSKVPFIVTGAASPDICKPVEDSYATHKYIFRAWVNSERQALSLAFVCRDILKGQAGFTRFAIAAENLKWARDYADVLKPKLKDYGLQVVHEGYHDPAIKDFTPIFRSAVDAKAQALLQVISNEAG
jgi:branched-chain amino acid transport system substrate-binding protein